MSTRTTNGACGPKLRTAIKKRTPVYLLALQVSKCSPQKLLLAGRYIELNTYTRTTFFEKRCTARVHGRSRTWNTIYTARVNGKCIWKNKCTESISLVILRQSMLVLVIIFPSLRATKVFCFYVSFFTPYTFPPRCTMAQCTNFCHPTPIWAIKVFTISRKPRHAKRTVCRQSVSRSSIVAPLTRVELARRVHHLAPAATHTTLPLTFIPLIGRVKKYADSLR